MPGILFTHKTLNNIKGMKKYIIISGIIALFYISACGQICKDKACTTASKATTSKTDSVALVCKLTPEQQQKRSEELRNTVFKKFEKLNELPDAVELIYSDAKTYAPVLVEFITTERACCPFFTFDLKFEPNSDKVALTIGGSAKIKEVIKSMIK